MTFLQSAGRLSFPSLQRCYSILASSVIGLQHQSHKSLAGFQSLKTASVSKTHLDHVIIPVMGIKHNVSITRRCKDCNFTRVENRLAVICSSHPRHNQIQRGKGASKRLHKTYPWKWPDPFDPKYGKLRYHEDRYVAAFYE